MIEALAGPLKPDQVLWVDFRCPNVHCRRYIVTVAAGTPIQRGYCSRCGLKYENQVAR